VPATLGSLLAFSSLESEVNVNAANLQNDWNESKEEGGKEGIIMCFGRLSHISNLFRCCARLVLHVGLGYVLLVVNVVAKYDMLLSSTCILSADNVCRAVVFGKALIVDEVPGHI
jgi:hypothetical protein